MKKLILFGSILSVFILLTIPHISAIEHQTRNEVIESKIDLICSNPIIDDYDWAEELLISIINRISNSTINLIFSIYDYIYVEGNYIPIPLIQFFIDLLVESSFYSTSITYQSVIYHIMNFIDFSNQFFPKLIVNIISILSIPIFIIDYYLILILATILLIPMVIGIFIYNDYDFPPLILFIVQLMWKILDFFIPFHNAH